MKKKEKKKREKIGKSTLFKINLREMGAPIALVSYVRVKEGRAMKKKSNSLNVGR